MIYIQKYNRFKSRGLFDAIISPPSPLMRRTAAFATQFVDLKPRWSALLRDVHLKQIDAIYFKRNTFYAPKYKLLQTQQMLS